MATLKEKTVLILYQDKSLEKGVTHFRKNGAMRSQDW